MIKASEIPFGAFQWHEAEAWRQAQSGYPSTVWSKRFPIKQIYDGTLRNWVAKLPANTYAGIRPQDCVPGSEALPSGHRIPGVQDVNKKCYIPDYNSPEYLAVLKTTLL